MLSDDEVAVFDVATVSDDSPVGYFIECDLHYPAYLHDLHNAYPLAPEHVKIEESMLSNTLRFMLDETNTKHTSSTKLLTNLRDKTHYVTHYRYLIAWVFSARCNIYISRVCHDASPSV